MSHECPDCGLTCFCNGDIDDCCFNSVAATNACTHCLEESGDEWFDGDDLSAAYMDDI